MPMSPRLLRPRASGTAVHPEALDWVTRVTANGGTVSSNTLAAVSTFCASIAAAGIRDRFWRLNLFCGTSDASLNAVRTPLYRGPSLTGTQYGPTQDSSLNLVAGDYAESGDSGGITGNGTNKGLDTGFVLSDAAVTTTGHIAAYRGPGTLASGRYVMGALNAAFSQIYIIGRISGTYDAYYGSNSPASSPSPPFSTDENALLLATRTSANSASFYYKGSPTGGISPFVSPASSERSLMIFGRNQGVLSGPAAITIRSYSAGASMTASQVTSYNAILQSFFAAIGRSYL